MAGLRLRLIGPAGLGPEGSAPCKEAVLCYRVRSYRQGLDHCNKYLEGLVVDSRHEDISCNKCDAGISNFCIPLRLGGETLGYLITGGYLIEPVDNSAKNRLRHLLGRMGIDDMDLALAEFEEATQSVNQAKHEALQRWLQMAAYSLIRSLELRDGATERPLPAFIMKICAIIQKQFQEPPSMSDAASICNLSEGYFCRAFHEHTGLRYVEYIQAVRVEHFCHTIQESETSITDAAFEVGFNSLSQFNRVFRKMKGTSPRQWRNQKNLGASYSNAVDAG